MTLKTVKVPSQYESLFEKAEEHVKGYFDNFSQNPTNGTITIGGERYILVRASSMSVHFLEHIKNMYPAFTESESIEAASRVLFDIAHTIGENDAVAFHKSTHVTDPVAKLSTGPIHFSYSGWSYVEIHPESRPSPDENYYLLYDHPQSFEADSWLDTGKKTEFCACFMNAGYSTGWCESSFGIELTTQEILCRARGDEFCRFIMAPPEKIDDYVQVYMQEHSELFL